MGAMAMARRKGKPHVPPVAVDLGPNTPAQWAGARMEQREHRKHAIQGKRRQHPLDVLLRSGTITRTECDAGFAYLDAWEACHQQPERTGVYVDHTPDFDAIALRRAEVLGHWSAMRDRIPQRSLYVIDWVVIGRVPLDGVPGYLKSRQPYTVDKEVAERHKMDLRLGLRALRG